jgi:guanine nucleotide-binding protein G(i) subunit alpha
MFGDFPKTQLLKRKIEKLTKKIVKIIKMGLCVPRQQLSKAELVQYKDHLRNEEMMKAEAGKEKKVCKILILGTGESGKSTIFKQMQLLYASGFQAEHRLNYKMVIRKNLIESMQTLIAKSAAFGFEFESKSEHAAVQALTGISATDVADLQSSSKMANYLLTLWKSNAIRKTYERRHQFYIVDSAD